MADITSTAAPAGGTPTGDSLIAGVPTAGEGEAFHGAAPAGVTTGLVYRTVSPSQLDTAMAAAVQARIAPIDHEAMAVALETAADAIEADTAGVVATADAETALGVTRLTGEVGRTVGQLRMMAAEAREGTRRDVVDDPAGDGPANPALLRTTVPLGVVAVFAASNFPLAFGVAGTDTAAALAAGCPVIAKAHPAQPATAERVGRAISAGIAAAGLPAGFYSVLHEEGYELGQALAGHADLDAVAFTGSHAGGRALFDLAAARPRPIPVYAEMGSLNPLIVSAGAAASAGEGLCSGILGSALMGEGQFCTKPGLVLLPACAAGAALSDQLAAGVAEHEPAHPLLHEGISSAFESGLSAVAELEGVTVVRAAAGDGGCRAALLQVTSDALLAHAALRQELFGPVTVVATVDDAQLGQVVEVLDPALTATLHAGADEREWVRSMADRLARKVGRVILGGYPTGVRVSAGQQHGGPYPATTSPLHTSVGLASIDRFLRPVAFQSFAPDQLPSWAVPGGA